MAVEKNAKAPEVAEVTTPDPAATQALMVEMVGDLSSFMVRDGEHMGLDEMTGADIRIPVYSLLQPLSQQVSDEKGHLGHFFDNTTGEEFKEMTISLLSVTKTRVKWMKPFVKGGKPICRSFDHKHGIGDPGDTGIPCAKCPDKEFGANNEPPLCKEGYNWLCYHHETGTIFRFTAISAGIKPVKNFYTQFVQNYAGFQLFIFKVKLAAEKISDSKGTYFVPKFDFTGPMWEYTYKDEKGVERKKQLPQICDQATMVQLQEAIVAYKDMMKKDIEDEIESGGGVSYATDSATETATSEDEAF